MRPVEPIRTSLAEGITLQLGEGHDPDSLHLSTATLTDVTPA